jgi:Family of unknown function (DUF6496)
MAKKASKRKYSKGSAKKVERAMKKRNSGTLRSGRSKKKVTSRKQAIAIGLSEARREGQKVPKKASKKASKKVAKKRKSKKRKAAKR